MIISPVVIWYFPISFLQGVEVVEKLRQRDSKALQQTRFVEHFVANLMKGKE